MTSYTESDFDLDEPPTPGFNTRAICRHCGAQGFGGSAMFAWLGVDHTDACALDRAAKLAVESG